MCAYGLCNAIAGHCGTENLLMPGTQEWALCVVKLLWMTPEQQERVRLLCKLTADEADPTKVEALAARLANLLSADGKPRARPKSTR
jgi:hypothetical protein